MSKNHDEYLDKTANSGIFSIMIPLKKHPIAKNVSLIKRGFLKKQLLKESTMVAADSMTVLEEFERFEEQYSLNDLSGQGHGGERK